MLAAMIIDTDLPDALEEAQGDLVVSCSEIADLVQEEFTDTGIARIGRLIAQMQDDFARSVEAYERRKLL